ncbi:MAG: peptidoglycan editing factor PgeF [Campylobacterales bacterium]|nr:peptidoglycan editing factor PgeF [Campylobacterales bacterium]
MQLIKSNLFNNFSNLTHALTTRHGGVSQKPYDSLNLAWHVGDDAQLVEINHKLLSEELGYDKNSLIHMKQIHSNLVHVVIEEDDFFTPRSCDALITNKKNTPLMVMVADCSPLLFYDDVQKVIAVAHAGRAGAFKNIVKNVVDCFVNEFACEPQNLYVTVGASIGVCCYEVGQEVYDEACAIGLEYTVRKKENRYYLDVTKILQSQLLECGVKKENLEISDECTSCKNESYFSYRKSGVTGRFAGLLMIK